MIRQIAFIFKWTVVFILLGIALYLKSPYLLKIRDMELNGEQYYDAMYGVIQSDKNQHVSRVNLRKSEQRLERVIQEVVCRPINNLTCQTIP